VAKPVAADSLAACLIRKWFPYETAFSGQKIAFAVATKCFIVAARRFVAVTK